MILRRLAEAIAKQNWFTVMLEVLIVVVGIFTGLQADDWTQEENAREMIRLMVRFSNEANLDIPQRFIDEIKKGAASPNKE